MLTWSDVVYYLRMFLRWWYVLALAVLLSVGTAWYMTRKQPDIYLAQTTLMVGNNFEVSAPSQAQVALSNVLADYYAALMKREVILAPVVERLQLSFPWQVIRDRMLTSRIDRGANLLELKITDTNAERGAAIANAIAEQLIAYTPNAPEKVAAQQAELSRRIAESQANVEVVEAKIAELEERLKGLSSAIDISDMQQQLDALQLTRQRYLDEYTNLINLSNETSANSLSIFEQARPAVAPLPQKRSLTLAMAGAGGLLIALVAVLVLDRLDERWRTGSELQSRTGIRSLGEVPEGPPPGPGPRPTGGERAQALNSAYSNMVLAAKGKLPRTLLISSPHGSAARSALAVDLATLYARSGHRVLLIDTEGDQAHIAALLDPRPAETPDASGRFAGPGNIWAHVRPSTIHNLLVLSGREAGYARLSSLVPLVFWPELLEHVRNTADIVIFDGPTALDGPEAGILAPLVDGVMLELNGRQDPRSLAIKAHRQLTSEPATRFLGAIVTERTRRTVAGGAAVPASSGLRIAVSRRGITLYLGDESAAPAPAGSTVAPAQRLLSPPETPVEAPSSVARSAVNGNGHAGYGAEAVTLEDLLEVAHGAAGGQPNGQITAGTNGSAPAVDAAVAQPPRAIITPPPVEVPAARVIITPPAEAQAANVQRNGNLQSAMAGTHPRRARIANGRRAGRTAQPGRSRVAEGVEGIPVEP